MSRTSRPSNHFGKGVALAHLLIACAFSACSAEDQIGTHERTGGAAGSGTHAGGSSNGGGGSTATTGTGPGVGGSGGTFQFDASLDTDRPNMVDGATDSDRADARPGFDANLVDGAITLPPAVFGKNVRINDDTGRA